MKLIKVDLKNNHYNIHLGENVIQQIPYHISRLNLGNTGLIITSPRVYSLYKKVIKKIFKNNYKIVVLADGERVKSKEWLFYVIGEIMKIDTWNKKIFLICLGGGTIGDLGGFAASIYKRGIPYIQIPTTLLSQIDASIGGKTGIDFALAKNILGRIYQPSGVFVDPIFLNTLPLRNIKEGIAEAIKYGIIKNQYFFTFLKNNNEKIMRLERFYISKLLWTCIGIKVSIVEKDENEMKGIRTILNFGHTLAHALEASTDYKNISHGEAVALGMVYAAELSFLLGRCNKDTVQSVRDIIESFSLPLKTQGNYNKIYDSLKFDKKFITGGLRMALLRKIGQVEVVDNIPEKAVSKSLKQFVSL